MRQQIVVLLAACIPHLLLAAPDVNDDGPGASIGRKLARVFRGDDTVISMVFHGLENKQRTGKDITTADIDQKILIEELESQVALVRKYVGLGNQRTILLKEYRKVNNLWILEFAYGLEADARFFSAIADDAIEGTVRLRRPLTWSIRFSQTQNIHGVINGTNTSSQTNCNATTAPPSASSAPPPPTLTPPPPASRPAAPSPPTTTTPPARSSLSTTETPPPPMSQSAKNKGTD